MIVIGINGHTGAGKKTTSNLLFQDKIHRYLPCKLLLSMDVIF